MGKAVEQPIVLGGYFTTRHLVNAWNRVYLSNEEPRDHWKKQLKILTKSFVLNMRSMVLASYED